MKINTISIDSIVNWVSVNQLSFTLTIKFRKRSFFSYTPIIVAKINIDCIFQLLSNNSREAHEFSELRWPTFDIFFVLSCVTSQSEKLFVLIKRYPLQVPKFSKSIQQPSHCLFQCCSHSPSSTVRSEEKEVGRVESRDGRDENCHTVQHAGAVRGGWDNRNDLLL